MSNFLKKIYTNSPKSIRKTLRNKRFKKIKWRKVGYYGLYFLIGLCFLTAILFVWFAKDLPTPSKIANRKAVESTKIYDRTGQTLLYETGEQKRTIIKSDQISQNLKDATVATEDASFYKHHGFDIHALAIALWEKATGKRRSTRGASTITQQYVKNALLTSDRSFSRKIKELILSIELEFMYKKDDILTMYMNEIPYGNNTAGTEAASKMYFGKPAKDLTLAEAATLAAIPQAPTYYSPYGTHTKELTNRKNYVLDRMVATGKINADQAEAAKKEDTLALGTTLKPRKDSILAPHFVFYVLENVAEKYGEDQVQKEGLRIITTLDFDKQKMAEESIAAGQDKFIKYGATNAAMTAIDPKTGQVLAMVGSRDYFNIEIDGNVNVSDSLRQPGSSFKPLTYATLFKKKEYSPSKILFDLQTDFGGGYVPKNYNGRFNGPVTIRQALSNSLNIPAVKAMSLAGVDNVLRTSSDLGITTLKDSKNYGLSLGLGTGEVKPVEMAGAFGVFANGGVKHDINSVLKITDSKGKNIYEYDQSKDKGKEVLDPQIAYEISSILKDNNARSMIFGSRSTLYFPNRVVAAKTGTTQDNKDGWTNGFTPSIAVSVWVGNNKGQIMKGGADGSVVAAPIFHTFIDKALADKPNEDFPRPKEIQEISVDKFSNKLPTEFSPEQTKDLFASWQIPADRDDIHVKLKICKINNKLAPDGMPAAAVEERLFTNLHSERPDNQSWEGPVRGWAESAGLSNSPPKDYCSTSDVAPEISITSPAQEATVSGSVNITVNFSTGASIKSVEYFIDNVSIGSINSSPYSLTYDFNSLSGGSHKLTAVATDNSGNVAKAENTITVSKGSGLTISNVDSEKLSSTSTRVTWTTSAPATSKVMYKKSSDDSYSTETNLDTSLVLSHSVTINGLLPGTTYNYRAVSKNPTANETFSAEKSFSL